MPFRACARPYRRRYLDVQTSPGLRKRRLRAMLKFKPEVSARPCFIDGQKDVIVGRRNYLSEERAHFHFLGRGPKM